MKVALFSAKPYEQELFTQKCVGRDIHLSYFTESLSKATTHLAREAHAICAFVSDDLSKEVIDELCAMGIRLIALRSTGYDHVDLKAAKGKITVVRVPDYSPYAVAEHALSLLLASSRHLVQAVKRSKEHNFSLEGLVGRTLHGKTAGIVGAGRIGKTLMRLLKGFTMRLIAHDIIEDPDFAREVDCSYVPLRQLLRESDFVSLHCPLTESNRHMISKETLSLMKRDACIINTARGALIHTGDLLSALKQKTIAAAALDVYENERPYFFKDCSQKPLEDFQLAQLLKMPNVLVTAHMGYLTLESLGEIVETTLSNIEDFIKGKPLKNVLD